MIELDQELITSLSCPVCHTLEQVLKPLNTVSFEAGHCPTCGTLRETELTHVITGDENFLHRTLANVGVPALHILRAHNGQEYRFYELTKRCISTTSSRPGSPNQHAAGSTSQMICMPSPTRMFRCADA
jgi:hypothetical protein